MKNGNPENGQRYLVMFRLSSDLLKQYYDTSNIKKSWDDISRFMKKNGFEHLKDTTYVSKSKMNEPLFLKIVESLISKYPWLYLSNNVLKCYSIDKEFLISTIIGNKHSLLNRIDLLQKFPPGLNRGGFSVSGKKQNSPKPAIPPTPTKPDTVTVPLEDLKEIFEAGVDMNVTVKKEELEKAKKQVEDKKQQSGASKKTTAPPEQKKTNKPKR